MSLLHQIQQGALDETSSIGSILLKLRFLGTRIGSDALEEWVKYESEGYPAGVEVPEYRRLLISYVGTFDCVTKVLNRVPIPTAAIKKWGGEGFLSLHERQGMAALDDLLKDETGTLTVGVSDLALKLQGKVFPDCACIEVIGTVSRAAVASVQHVVRSRVLELTTEIEKRFPDAVEIAADSRPGPAPGIEVPTVNTIINKVVYGGETNVINTGAEASVQIAVVAGDKASLAAALEHAGLSGSDATELAEIAADEEPEKGKSFGRKAGEWMAKKLDSTVDGAAKYGGKVATEAIAAYLRRYYDI